MFGKFLLFKIDAVMFCLFICPTSTLHPNTSSYSSMKFFLLRFPSTLSQRIRKGQDLSVTLYLLPFSLSLDIVCVCYSFLGEYFTYIYLSYKPTLGGQKNSEPRLLNCNTNSLNSWDFNLKDIHLLLNKSRVAWPKHI